MGTTRRTTKARPTKRAAQAKPSPVEKEDASRPPTPLGAEWVWVTPDLAATMLKKNGVNRDLRSHDLQAYVRMMENKEWGTCVEPLVFDSDENLLNGQHRLHAMTATETSHWFLVLHGVPPDVAKTVNGGARASLADVLKYNGEQNYILLAGVAGNTYLWQHQMLALTTRVSPIEGEKWLNQHPELRHSVDMGRHTAQVSVIDIGPTVLGVVHWIIAQDNGTAEADLFLTRMAYLQKEEPGSPILALLRRLNKGNLDKSQRLSTRDQIATLIRIWNYSVEGRYVKKVNIRRGGTYEHPIPLKKDNPRTREELSEFLELPRVEDVVPPLEDQVDEGEEV